MCPNGLNEIDGGRSPGATRGRNAGSRAYADAVVWAASTRRRWVCTIALGSAVVPDVKNTHEMSSAPGVSCGAGSPDPGPAGSPDPGPAGSPDPGPPSASPSAETSRTGHPAPSDAPE